MLILGDQKNRKQVQNILCGHILNIRIERYLLQGMFEIYQETQHSDSFVFQLLLKLGFRVEALHGQLTLNTSPARSRKILRNKEESQHDC